MKDENKKNSVEISFSHYYNDSDIKEFNNLELDKYTVKATKSPKPPEASGGLIWYGIIIFLGSQVAGGFLQELGKDIYNKIKDKLFEKKNMLQKRNSERFTINIQCNQSMVFADLTNLNKPEFDNALRKLSETFEKNRKVFENNSKWYDLTFNNKSKIWEISENENV